MSQAPKDQRTVAAGIPTEPESPDESRFRKLLEAAPDAILEVDVDGRIVLLNQTAERMFGYSRHELIGQKIAAWYPGRHGTRTGDYKASGGVTRGKNLGGERTRERKPFPLHIAVGQNRCRGAISAGESGTLDLNETNPDC
jgi:PAS domain-containing protein